jgi:hypothetical protein
LGGGVGWEERERDSYTHNDPKIPTLLPHSHKHT